MNSGQARQIDHGLACPTVGLGIDECLEPLQFRLAQFFDQKKFGKPSGQLRGFFEVIAFYKPLQLQAIETRVLVIYQFVDQIGASNQSRRIDPSSTAIPPFDIGRKKECVPDGSQAIRKEPHVGCALHDSHPPDGQLDGRAYFSTDTPTAQQESTAKYHLNHARNREVGLGKFVGKRGKELVRRYCFVGNEESKQFADNKAGHMWTCKNTIDSRLAGFNIEFAK